jgi:hypothetical protein
MDIAHVELLSREARLILAWPGDGVPQVFLRFEEPGEWRRFIDSLGIHPAIPDLVQAKFARAQTLYLLGWVDFGLIKAGELAALVALELAVTDRYAGFFEKPLYKPKPGGTVLPEKVWKPSFAALLRYMVKSDGLTDADIPMAVRCGGSATGQLVGEVHPTLADRRNALAHGDPFEGLPTAGLLELVRDLINYAYRGYIAEAVAAGRV